MKFAILALAAALLTAQTVAADTGAALPRPDQLTWQCGLISKTTVTPAGFTFTLVNRADKWVLGVADAEGQSAAMADALNHAVGARTLAAVGYHPQGAPASRLAPRGTAHSVMLGNAALGCSKLKFDARRDYARAYAQRDVSPLAKRAHPKIMRIKTLKQIR